MPRRIAFTKKSDKVIGIKYGGKNLRIVTYGPQANKRYVSRDDVRLFAQAKSNQIARNNINENIAILLHYEGIERPHSGGFTSTGQAVKLHDVYDGGLLDEDTRITGFSIEYTY
eukprot:Lithocolla_globosa_v1_NODE_2847_length_1849_cov_547.481048.p2 type:complete len:114 gc:universal NODE_2847_length_1849_cov_547.481048:1786-1445(-)